MLSGRYSAYLSLPETPFRNGSAFFYSFALPQILTPSQGTSAVSTAIIPFRGIISGTFNLLSSLIFTPTH